MQKVSCPSCGAPVEFRSAASVMAVCEFCRTTLLKDAESVKDIGKMSATLEDYSPIRITTSGIFQGRRFAVVGRIQLRYDAGFWNEWYLLFDDGNAAWLSDASGQFVLTVGRGPAPEAPAYDALAPGAGYTLDGQQYYASDIRTARCTAGEGELPFRVGAGWEARVADFRRAAAFLTLDYSEGGPAQLYVGQAVTLAELQCQLLRSDDEISGDAFRYRGKTVALECPSCGAGIKYVAGMAFHVVCASCHSEVECGADRAVVLEKHAELAAIRTTLSLGDKANIDGAHYELIGLMKCATAPREDADRWTEYLLFEPKRGFLWLVETESAWERVVVLNEWPEVVSASTVRLHGEAYLKREEYASLVEFAAGAFNWRIAIGDRTRVTDYAASTGKLSAEWSRQEVTWSAASPLDVALVLQWFGKSGAAPDGSSRMRAAVPAAAAGVERIAARIASVATLIFNLPLTFSTGINGLIVIAIALILLWLPILLSARASESI